MHKCGTLHPARNALFWWEVCLCSRWQEPSKRPTTTAQRSSRLSRSEPSVDKKPSTIWYEDVSMTFVECVHVVIVGKCYFFIIIIFIIAPFICYLLFSSSQPLFAVSVSVHDFKTIATSRQAFGHGALKHLGTKYSSGLSLCCITSCFLNPEARKKVSQLASATCHWKITFWRGYFRRKEAWYCFVSRCRVQ